MAVNEFGGRVKLDPLQSASSKNIGAVERKKSRLADLAEEQQSKGNLFTEAHANTRTLNIILNMDATYPIDEDPERHRTLRRATRSIESDPAKIREGRGLALTRVYIPSLLRAIKGIRELDGHTTVKVVSSSPTDGDQVLEISVPTIDLLASSEACILEVLKNKPANQGFWEKRARRKMLDILLWIQRVKERISST